jgi:hypothetical protein
MARFVAFASGAAFTLGGLVAGMVMLGGQYLSPEIAFGPKAATIQKASWVETRWPFPPDIWGKGKAFRCAAAHCGTEMSVFVRPKIGFCNCATGVADDDELARIGDIDLLAYRLSARGTGRPIKIAWMNGRSRTFVLADQRSQGFAALSIGFNDRCDAIVATAVIDRYEPAMAEAKVLELLNGRPVLGWIEVALGL